MNKRYKLSLGLEHDSIGLHGIGSQIKAAGSLMQLGSLQGDDVLPEMIINGVDIFPIIFERDGALDDSMELCPNESLKWSSEVDIAHVGAIRRHLKWSSNWINRCSEKLRKIGNPINALSLRGTDKIDGEQMILPTIVYKELIESCESPVLILSDTNYGLADLEVLSNARTLKRIRSESLFPVHRTRMMDVGLRTGEELLQHTLEMFEDIYILGQCNTIYYPVFHGVMQAGLLLSDSKPKLQCLQDNLSPREKLFVNFYQGRETHFWSRLDQ